MDLSGVFVFVSPSFVVGVIRAGVIGLGLGFISSLLLAPFLSVRRLRSLFAAVGPTDHWSGNVPLVMALVGAIELSSFVAVRALGRMMYADPTIVASFITLASIVLFLGYVGIWWVLPLFVLPRLGVNWDEQSYGLRTMGVLGACVLWYHVSCVLLSPYFFDWLPPLFRLF